MAKIPLIGILLLVLAAAAIWLLSDHAAEPTAVPTTTDGAPAIEPATAEGPAITAEPPPTATAGRDPAASERTEVATGLAIVGQVLDDGGQPVEGATVTGTTTPAMPGGPGNRGGNRAGFDFANRDFADFDLNGLVERFRTQQRERVQVTTDGEGHFRLVPVGEGRNVFLRVAAHGYLMLDRSARRPTTANVDVGPLPLQRGAVVSGRVVDGQVRPIEGAKVARRRRGEGLMGVEFEFPGADLLEDLRDGDGGVTDADGRFELPHVAPGEFSLRARHPDHPIAHLDGLTVTAGQTLSDLLVVVEPGATIQGTVVDVPAGTRGLRVQASDRQGGGSGGGGQQGGRMDFSQLLGDAGSVLADLGLAVGEKSVELEADGSFVLRGLRVGHTYRLWVAQTARGFVGSGACSEPTDVAAGTVGTELRYDPGITVTCRVVEADTDTPVERLFVGHRLQGGSGGLRDLVSNLVPSGGRAKDYPDGRVTVTDLRPSEKQTLRLSIDAVGYSTLVRESVALPNSGNLDLGTLPLTRTPVLEVQVTTTDEGQPVAGVAVRLQAPRDRGRGGGGNPFAAMGNFAGRRGGGPLSGRTDAAGRCVLNSLPGTTATLTVQSPEHAPYEATIALPADDATHAARLLRGGSVEVTVQDTDGAPLARTRVEHAPPNGRRDTKTTDKEGRAVFERLTPGAHRFRMSERRGGGPDLAAMAARFGGVSPGADDASWTTVEVTDGASSGLQLAKSLTASLRGIVRENGVPLASARIAFLKGPAGSEADTPQGRMAGAFAGMGGRGRGGRTGEDGSYAMKELPAGQHRLRITHRSRTMPTTVELALRLGDNVLDLDLQTTVLRGTVRDPQGVPIEGATISVRQSGSGADPLSQLAQGSGFDLRRMGGRRGSVTTGADGSFELRGVADGVPLLVTASAKGRASGTSAPVQLPAGGVQEGVDVQLSAAGSIEVTASGGGMFRAARATLLAADGNPEPSAAPRMQMLRRGGGTIEGVRPGRYKVEMMGTNGPSGEPIFVEVVAGATAKVAF